METITLENRPLDEAVMRAKETLEKGGIVVAPTDTVYGILGSAASEDAIKKIFAVKKRPREKAFPIFVRDVPAARTLAYIADAKARFLERVWPGPVTVVFQHKEKLPRVLTGGLDTLGIRIPDHPFISALLERADFPLVQTSANISENPPAKTLEEVKMYFENAPVTPDLAIDGGACGGSSSTVIDYTGAHPIILRTGLVTKEELDEMLKGMVE